MTVHFKAMLHDGLERGVATEFNYPGGELHLKNIQDLLSPETVWIADVRFGNASKSAAGGALDDLGYAAMLAKVAHKRQAPFVLMLPYLPAARADHGEPLGAEVYTDFISSMNPQQVIGIDPHSQFIVDYFDRCMPGKLTELDATPLVKLALGRDPTVPSWDGVIAPDKGALGRAAMVADTLGCPLYTAKKVRDHATGRIIGYTPPRDLPQDGNFLVVDDICDGGSTFKILAKATGLPKEQLNLWVTHGIFSGAADSLREHYERIYTTDSHPGHGRVGVATNITPVEVYMLQNMKEFA
jgi:phosphoribosylpyrophosphate synthetase